MKRDYKFEISFISIYFLASMLFFIVVLGVVIGYRNHDSMKPFLGEMRTAIKDVTQNPLTRPNKYDTDPGLVFYEDFVDEGHLLVSGYLVDGNRIGIKLIDLSSKKVIKSWYPDPSEIREQSDYSEFKPVNRFEPQSPYLMADGGLVFIDNQGPLVRIDACSNIEWIVDGHFHHSLERDLHGNFVVPGVADGFSSPPVKFRDDAVMTIDAGGHVIGSESVAQILLDNGYIGLLYAVYPADGDPIHLNDVEVASTSTDNWKQGDWLLSLRVLNAVLIYRPSTGKVIWLQIGPWLKQHDPDFREDGTISVFGNDVFDNSKHEAKEFLRGHSDIYIVDPSRRSIETPYTSVMSTGQVGTKTQGLVQMLEDGDAFIEETDTGRILRINKQGFVWSYYNSDGEIAGVLNWSRYLPKDHLKGVDITSECADSL